MAHGYATEVCPAATKFKHSLIPHLAECPQCYLPNSAFKPPSNTSRINTTPTSTSALASGSVLVVSDDDNPPTVTPTPVEERAKHQVLKGQLISRNPGLQSRLKTTSGITSTVNKPLKFILFVHKGIIRSGMDEFDIAWSEKGLSTSFNIPNEKIDNIESFMDTLGAKSHSYENIQKKLEDGMTISERYLATDFKKAPMRIPTDTTNTIKGQSIWDFARLNLALEKGGAVGQGPYRVHLCVVIMDRRNEQSAQSTIELPDRTSPEKSRGKTILRFKTDPSIKTEPGVKTEPGIMESMNKRKGKGKGRSGRGSKGGRGGPTTSAAESSRTASMRSHKRGISQLSSEINQQPQRTERDAEFTEWEALADEEAAAAALADEERAVFDNTRMVEDREDVDDEGDDEGDNTRSDSSLSSVQDLATVVKTRHSREARPNYKV